MACGAGAAAGPWIPRQGDVSRDGDTSPADVVRHLANAVSGQRSLFLNAGSLFGATLLTAAIGGVYWALAARSFAPAAVGLAAAAISAMQLIAQLSTFGLGTVLMGELSEHRGAERRLIDSALGITATVGLVVAAAFTAVVGLLAPELDQLRVPAGVALFAIGAATTAVGLVLDQALLGLLRGAVQLLRNALASIVKLAALVVVALVVSDRSSGLLLFLTWVVGGVASMVVLAALPGRGADSSRPIRQALEGVGGLAIRHHLLNLAILAPGLLLPLVITGVLSAEANAYFYVAYLIASFAWAVPAALSTAVYAAGARDQQALASRVRLVFGVAIATGVAVNLVLTIAAEPLLGLFGGSYADRATMLLRVFGLGIFPITLNSLFVPIARVERRFLEGAALMLLSMVIEFGFVIAGARLGGLQGSGTGWLVGYTLGILPFLPTLLRVGVRREVRPISRDLLGALPPGGPRGRISGHTTPGAAREVARASDVRTVPAPPSVLAIGILTDTPRLSRWQSAVVRALSGTEGVSVTEWLCLDDRAPDRAGGFGALAAAGAGEIPPGLPLPRQLTQAAESPSLGAVERGPVAAIGGLDTLLDLTARGMAADVPAPGRDQWHFVFGSHDARDPLRAVDVDLVAGAGGTRVRLVAGDGAVLREGVVKREAWSVSAHLDAILLDTAAFPAQVCAMSMEGHVTTKVGDRSEEVLGGAGVRPAWIEALPTGALRAGRGFRRVAAASDRLRVHNDWNVGIVDRPIESFLTGTAPDPVQWLPTIPGRYFADPFGVDRDGHLHLFFEDYDQRRGRGVVSHLEVGTDGVLDEPRPVLVPDGHVSYPYLLESNGELWMIPETADELEVRLYRAVDFPARWQVETVLVSGIPVSDPTVTAWGGQWWLFGTSRGRGVDHALRLWHAPALTGPWRLHRLDPVKVDARSARPAGTPFVADGTLFRPSQDSSRRYGGRVVINRVVMLDERGFVEEVAVAVEPLRNSDRADGIHTLSAVGRRTLVDGNRLRFVPGAFVHELERAVRGSSLFGARGARPPGGPSLPPEA